MKEKMPNKEVTPFVPDRELINNSLKTGILDIEMSEIARDDLITEAPNGKVFIVPNEIWKKECERQAKSLERKDLKFEIEE